MMETLSHLSLGFGVALTLKNIALCFAGCLVGTLIGVLPGVGPIATISILLPITFGLDPTGALIMLAGIYYGAQYGGSTTAILVNIPGEATSVVTTLDGHQMAKQGRAGIALGIAAIGSFFAGCVATLIIAALGAPLTKMALLFGPAEYFSLMVMGLCFAVVLARGSILKAFCMIMLGLLFSTVGTDLETGQERLTFGVASLSDGIDFSVLAMGVFGFAEVLRNLESPEARDVVKGKIGRLLPGWADIKQSAAPVLRGTFVGGILGILPGNGAVLGPFASYTMEKKIAKDPSRFGKGAIEGVAGPEAANNASAAGTLVPLLTLGLPTSATAAIMLAGFQQYGLNPGPLLFAEKPDLVWGLIASLFIANVMLVILNLPLVGLWVRLLAIPQPWLYAGILVFATMGTLAVNGSPVELTMLFAFGFIGYLMRRYDYPVAPMVVGLILGPMAEAQLRRALQISLGDPMILLENPISATLLGIAFLALVAPFAMKGLNRFKASED